MQLTTLNLIPENAAVTGNYFCTWGAQLNVPEQDSNGPDVAAEMRNHLTWDFLRDLLSGEMQSVRKDLIVVLDDGWDVPYNTGSGHKNRMGSMCLNPEKFPLFHVPGKPGQSLRKLSDAVQALGYAGAGLWVSGQIPWDDDAPYAAPPPETFRRYWEERAAESCEGGILYWKVDWSAECNNPELRQIMTEAVRKYAPGLRIEHALVQQPVKQQDAAEFELEKKVIRHTLPYADFFRTYDIMPEFETVTTLFRCDLKFRMACPPQYGAEQILNVEDEPYVAAALGCANGIMRHRKASSFCAARFCGRHPRLYKPALLDESSRSVLFQRLAPPFGLDGSVYRASAENLTDSCEFHQDKWPFLQGICSESAPAVMARNCGLPDVIPMSGDDRPFVAAMRHPNGTYAVSALPRFRSKGPEGESVNVWEIPPAEIVMRLDSPDCCTGIFGEFASVTFLYPEPVENRQVLLQDPLAESAWDVTSDVKLNGNALTIPGEILRRTGLSGSTPGDLSRPGAVLRLLPHLLFEKLRD